MNSEAGWDLITPGASLFPFEEEFKDIYIASLIKNKIKNKIKAVVACGNGTAGIFAPKVLKGIRQMHRSRQLQQEWPIPIKLNQEPIELIMPEEQKKSVIVI